MRKGFDDRAAQPAQETERDPGAELLPCAFCHGPTPRAQLSNYGARCWACYEWYLESGESTPHPAGWRPRVYSSEETAAARQAATPKLAALLQKFGRQP